MNTRNKQQRLPILLMYLAFSIHAIFVMELAHSSESSIHDPHGKLMGDYFGQALPGVTPEQFAPFIVASTHHKHSAPAFSPNGKEVFFSVYLNFEYPQQIYHMRQIGGEWTQPQPASFSTPQQEGGPVFSADGTRIFFNSKRPIDGSDVALEDNNIWYAERTDDGWSDAVNPGPPLNTSGSEYAGFLSKDSQFYFTRETERGDYDIFESSLIDGKFSSPRNIGPQINTVTSFDSHPVLAADGSYMIFTSFRRSGDSDLGLYMSVKKDDGSWSDAHDVGDAINSGGSRFPGLSADGSLLFFTSMRSGEEQYYWVSSTIITKLISSL